MSHDATLKLVTNLDRTGIDALLANVRRLARDKGLADLDQIFAGLETMSNEQVRAAVGQALAWTSGREGLSDLRGPLELAELNLPNLR